MNSDGTGFCLTVFCCCLFCWVVSSLISSASFVPVLVMLLQTAWSEAASSQLLALMRHTFMSCLHTSLNLKCGCPFGQEPVISSPYSTSLGILPLPMHLTWPSHCIQHYINRLCMLGVPVCCRTLVLDILSFHVILRMCLRQWGWKLFNLLHDGHKLSMFHCCTEGCWECKLCRCRSRLPR